MWREVSSTYITRAQITRANIDFNGGGSRLVHCRDRLADASGEDLGRGHLHEQLTGLHTVPVPRGCATTVSSRPLGTGSGARGSLPRPQRLQHAQNCIEVLMLRTRSGSQINQYTAIAVRKSAKKASPELMYAIHPETIDQVHHAHRQTNMNAERTHPFFRSHVLVPPAIRGLWQHQKTKEPPPHMTRVANNSHGKNPPGA